MRRSVVVTIAVLTVSFGLVGNLAAGILQVPEQWKPWVFAAAGVLAVAMVIIEVYRGLNHASTAPRADRSSSADRSSFSPRPREEAAPSSTPATEVRSFEESWTGNETPTEFSKVHKPSWVEAILLYALSITFFVAAVAADQSDPLKYLAMALALGLGVGGLGYIERWGSLIALKRRLHTRSLRVDHGGVTTTDSSGDQHIPWAVVAGVAVRYIEAAIGGHEVLGLHLKLHPSSDAPTILYRPAGWPTSVDLPGICSNLQHEQWVPVCVLGPLPGPRRIALKNAVATYTKHSLKTNIDW